MQGITRAAIAAFDRLAKREHSAHRAEQDLHQYAGRIPDEDVDGYIKETSSIEARRYSACKVCSPPRVWAEKEIAGV